MHYSPFSEVSAQNLGPEKAHYRRIRLFLIENYALHSKKGRKMESYHFRKILKISFL